MALTEYARKRNFKTTREPGAIRERGKTGHRFVVQKHAATRLHYDFRLEMYGVLKSWAVPKGIPFVKGEKRLAVEVEDHPVSYIHFEGTIPKGQYGGGTVMVWDAGTYSASGNPLEELKQGKLHFTLSGKKLQGDWYLVRLRDGKQWLLIKGGEDLKSLSQKKDDSSALSGKSMDQIAGGDRVWQSVPRRGGKKLLFKERVREKASSPKASKGLPPSATRQSRGAFKFLEPMKARLATVPPAGDWLYEIKFDGYRALAIKNRDEVRLLSRNEKDFSKKFPEISDALAAWKTDDFIVDGEIVALDKKGVSSFQLLQAFELGEKRPPIYYYVFDLLRVGDDDYLQKSLKQRKEALAQLLKGAPEPIRFSASLAGTAKGLLKKVGKLGLEGLIGKRTDSVYEAGARSGAWIKLKLHREQEFVIGGFSDPEGSRQHFGALLIGFYEKNRLKFCGKVGTGFNSTLLRNLSSRFKAIASAGCPFVNLPEKRSGRFGAGVTAAEMRRCHWVEPEMVAQIKFSEWTRDEKLRQPVFLGLREDKDASEVVREKA